MKPYLQFLQSKRIMALACQEGEELWMANVYIGTDEEGLIYFISSKEVRHSQMILKNPKVAFSVNWFDPENHLNRKGIQGQGVCRMAENQEEMKIGAKLHNQNFPEFKERINLKAVQDPKNPLKVWVLKLTYLKYFDDELYGEKMSEEFHIN